MTFTRSFAIAPLVGLGMSILFACSSNKSTTPTSTACVDTQCAANNKCINDGNTTECRLVCTSQAGCPDKYRCVEGGPNNATYCAPLTGYSAGIVPNNKGQWGAHCAAVLDPKSKAAVDSSLDANPACDTDQSFWCYAQTPTDGEAFCTQYQCQSDSECKGGWYCATINSWPDISHVKRTVRQTTTVCLPRTYCATCQNDIDCPSVDGATQHCVAGSDGAKFCSPECANDGNCRLDATCQANDATGTNVCIPRAGTCKGDGSFCEPCRSDLDCSGDGVCITEQYSGEKYCGVKSGKACSVVNNALVADCPTTNAAKTPAVSCQTDTSNPFIPKDYCFGIINFGSTTDEQADGCWTRNPAK